MKRLFSLRLLALLLALLFVLTGCIQDPFDSETDTPSNTRTDKPAAESSAEPPSSPFGTTEAAPTDQPTEPLPTPSTDPASKPATEPATAPASKPATSSTAAPDAESSSAPATPDTPDGIPAYAGQPYAVLNGNIPLFESSQYTTTSYESYADTDTLGRCGVAIANVGIDLMPTEERGDIGSVTPTGWKSVKYDHISGKYLYNRCHLIGFQLSGENANEKNLITGTRYLNIEGMLPFENMIADYVKETENHVLYRVTPIFVGNNLVASGVRMEAYSVEDDGEGICFHVYAYNVQPGVTIDYATGNSWLSSSDAPAPDEPASSESPQNPTTDPAPESTEEPTTKAPEQEYILNTGTKKFHTPSCWSAAKIAAENKESVTASRDDLIEDGYSPCNNCKP